MLPTREAAVLAVFHLINAFNLRSDGDRGTAYPDAFEQVELTRFAPSRWNRAIAEGATLGRFKAPDALIASLLEPE